MKLSKNLAILALILSAVFWGASATITKFALIYIPPLSLGFIRFVGAAILFLPFVFRKINLKELTPTVILTALIGITAQLSLFYTGLKVTTALNAGIITAFSPILTLVAARFLLSERTGRNVLFGAAIGLLGIGIIIGQDFSSGLSLSPLGDFLILLSIFGSVYYSIFSKKILEKYPPILTTFYLLGIGGLGFTPFAVSEFLKNPGWLLNLPTTAVLALLYTIIFSSFLAHSLWQWGLSKMEATKVGIFTYLEPIVTTITAVMILSEKITGAFIIGSIFIFSGLLIAEVHRHRHPPHHR